jgi:hypothetical protein
MEYQICDGERDLPTLLKIIERWLWYHVKRKKKEREYIKSFVFIIE